MSEFTLDTFRKMLKRTKSLGPLNISMLPGMGGMQDAMKQVDADREIGRLVGIIDSMTVPERCNPLKLIDLSRCHRIAAGAGVEPREVSDLVEQFGPMAALMQRLPR